MKSAAFNELIAEAYRVELKTVTVYARFLKEAGELTTGARGVNAPHMTPRDAAVITIALLSTDSPARAVEQARKFSRLTYSPERSKGAPPSAFCIVDGTTLIDALTSLFSAGHDVFDGSPYLQIDENGQGAFIEHTLRNDAIQFRSPEHFDRSQLLGVRRMRGVASSELLQVHTEFYLERRDGVAAGYHHSHRSN